MTGPAIDTAFDWSWIDDLDGDAAADALACVRHEVLAAEAKQFVLAAHWADLHAGDHVDQLRSRLPGTQRLVPIRGGGNGCVEGCPEIEEYAAAELAALLGRSTVAGERCRTATASAPNPRRPGLGPVVLAEVRDWLAHPSSPDQIRQQVRVRPVLDASTVVPVDRYEWPAAMSELSTARTPYETFPFGTLPSRKADDDHRRPYVEDGPPGQTCLENNAKLSRFHHRLKTNGNWVLRHPDPGSYWWRTPHGHWFLVDTEGTHWHGRDPDLDRTWLHGGESRLIGGRARLSS